jgi:hypothetical protein
MSSGVRNLRAMFENQGAASPEPRGRSPGDNTATEEEVSTPKTKVRASFVSVVPTPGIPPPDLGTAKGAPSNSTGHHRSESFSVSQDNVEEIAELKREVGEEKEERRQSTAVAETVPEEAVASRESSVPAPPIREEPAGEMANLGSIMKGSDFPEPSATEPETAPVKETPKQPVETSAKEETKAFAPTKIDAPKQPKTPAKVEKKVAPAPKTENPAPTPVKKEPKTPKPAKATAPAPSKTPAASDEKPIAAAEVDAPVQPEAPVENKEDAAADVDTPVQPEALVESKEDATAAASEDAPALPKTLEKTEEKPVVAQVDETPAPLEAPVKIEESVAAAPIEVGPTVPETPEKTEEPSAPSHDMPATPEPVVETKEEPVAIEPIETPADNPDKPVTGAQEEVSLKPADTTDAAAVSGTETLPPPVELGKDEWHICGEAQARGQEARSYLHHKGLYVQAHSEQEPPTKSGSQDAYNAKGHSGSTCREA